MTGRVAPARYILTAVHLANDTRTRTLCGKPMDDDGLWQEVLLDGPMCRACVLVASRKAQP